MATFTASFTLSKLISSTPKSISTTTPPLFSSLKPLSSTTPSLLHHHRHHTPLYRRHSLKFSTKITATISVGDKLPDATLSYFDASDNLQTTTISTLTSNKKAVIFAVPGAFTPTCSQKHLPGFVENAKALKAKGVDTIACVSVNDAFVMKAWGEKIGIGGDVMLLSDGNLEFTKAIGCELDLSDKPVGLGVRSRRYAMLVDNGVVKVLNLEDGGAFNVSSAEDMLKAL
ncbi:hypothetical protein Leryth_008862 [Lithospermum erythrorhizon]|uniref:Glutaredoxin-dependent peroxiredoxin n=1 Tax=Lithospermum erythrorhizon TaxID=34254 RepID=A0AAV3NR53_LITER|nr:hypothetical protein Leryth_008862 [Lithospermum erythrorhizon]